MDNTIKDIKDKYLKKVYIGTSSIAGHGLFADEPIKAGEIILIFGGTLLINSERYSGNFLRSTCIGISENILLGEMQQSQKDFSDYINHSCDPNVGLEDAITLIAIRDIKEGEEILCDYAFWESNNDWKMKQECVCGAKNCRKFITGKDWMLIKSIDKHYKFFAPFLKRRILENEEFQT